MKQQFKGIHLLLVCGLLSTIIIIGCDKDEDPPLPQINGYNNSDEVGAANLRAYWSLDGNGNESKSSSAPTSSTGVAWVQGVKGQAAQLTNGYLYYANAIGGLATNQPFTVSAWIQVANNGLAGGSPPANNHPYQYFQAAIPGSLFGNINLLVEAGAFPTASDTMFLKSLYRDPSGGLQDAVLCCGIAGTDYMVVKKAGTGQWVNVVTTYNPAGGTGAQSIFRIYADGVHVSNKLFENRGTNAFTYLPHEIIIGGWYNNIPGKMVTADTWTTAFTGKIDEVRLWNKTLSADEITALYNLGKAGR
jgi:Concanavalin A-like lectin/glucanases superfamily